MMRISSQQFYNVNNNRLSTLQAQLYKTQEHITANKRVLTPADDPVAAARTLNLQQLQAMNKQFGNNRDVAYRTLALQESTLDSTVKGIQELQRLLVEAGDAIYNDTDLRSIADSMRGVLSELVGYANTRDSNGDYIFSGFNLNQQPYHVTATGRVEYKGDTGQRYLQVDSDRFMEINIPGSAIFGNIKGYTPATVESNRNDFVVDVKVLDSTDPDFGNHVYAVRFDGDPTHCTVFRDGTALTDYSYLPYSGNVNDPLVVTIDGVEITVSGQVDGNGDWLDISTGEAIATDVFTYVYDMIAMLESGTSENMGSINLALGIASMLDSMESALNQVLSKQSAIGIRMEEIDNLKLSGLDKDLLYEEQISDLVDLDYYSAYSQFLMQQFTLQAAQQTFTSMVGLSLFNYMK